MSEPRELAAARKHLSEAERGFRSADGLRHLEEGIALLDRITMGTDLEHRALAANLLSTYSKRICEAVKRVVESDAQLPEPELEHLFKVMLSFDSAEIELPFYVRSIKLRVVKRLIDLYYEGHPAEQKQKALEQLANLEREP